MSRKHDPDWHSMVYKHTHHDYPENWEEIRSDIIKRDKYTCYRCEKKVGSMGELSVHHITPRAEGGTEDYGNLIAMCHSCHDFVEEAGYRSRSEIMGSYEGDPINYKQNKSHDADRGKRTENFERPSWHSKVYGGRRSE